MSSGRAAAVKRIWSTRFLVSLSFVLLQGCAIFQKTDEVSVRPAGDPFLAVPVPAGGTADGHWEYAYLSAAAYRATPTGNAQASNAGPDSDRRLFEDLCEKGWKEMPGFDSWRSKIESHEREFHLRVQVWENREQNVIAVAFGGTDFTSLRDWAANLRWFIPDRSDVYTEVSRIFGPEFAEAYRTNYPDNHPGIVATGHSLGAGLAQHFAYALPRVEGVPRVSVVYAFDPTPVTGWSDVEHELRTFNAAGLRIERIYERYEFLAPIRSLIAFLAPPAAMHPTIVGYRYAFSHIPDAIRGHYIVPLAFELKEIATHGEKISGTSGCVAEASKNLDKANRQALPADR